TVTPPDYSQSQDEPTEQWLSPTPMMTRIRTNASPAPLLASFSPLKKENKPRRSKETKQPRPKPKHMDSQIEFQPIPHDEEEEAIESQLLTERQKEVKERQSDEQNLFSDISMDIPP